MEIKFDKLNFKNYLNYLNFLLKKPSTESITTVIAIAGVNWVKTKIGFPVMSVKKGENIEAVKFADAVWPVVDTFLL